MKNGIKTSFSKYGLCIMLMALIPEIIFKTYVFKLHKDILSLICIIANIYLFLSLVFLQNTAADKIDRRSRLFSLAAICYGIYFLFLVLFVIGRGGGPAILLAAHIFIYIFFVFFSIDRRNWLSLSGSIISMIAVIIRESLILGGLL